MKVVTYIAKFLKEKGIDTVFQLQGGMITRIIDEMQQEGGITIVTVHHEQTAAMAADAYARIKNKPGIAMATSGPGATNLITGIGNCYFDSVPAIFITGQVNVNELKGDSKIRQLGFQETDIVSIVRPITKAAYAVKEGREIPGIFEEAYKIAMEGRPGPVLIDIPMNVQYEECENVIIPSENQVVCENSSIKEFINSFKNSLKTSVNPLILAGRGIRVGGATSEFNALVKKLNIPVVTSLNAIDVVTYDNENRVGMIGSYGNRWANYALGTTDLLLVLGSRMDLRQTGSDIETFVKGKKIFHVDIDPAELNNRIKNCTVLESDVLKFINILLEETFDDLNFEKWRTELKVQKELRPDTKELDGIHGINPNEFIHQLSQKSKPAIAYTTDVGNNQMWAAQSVELTENQFFLTSGGMGAMGYALPAAIGACFAKNNLPVVCIAGDGGFQINIQELETIVRDKLPIKIVILNNHCLGMIRQFQDAYFKSQYTATVSGYSAPNFVNIAKAYGIDASRITNKEDVKEGLDRLWEYPNKPYLLEVSLDIHTNVHPKMLFGNPLTKMEPEIN